MRFLHAADLHLDSPLRGLDQDAPVEAIRGATRRALENLVSLALRERVAFVLLAGDLYDGEWQDCRTGGFLMAQLGRLTQAGIPVVAIRGNHDAESIITQSLNWPEGARLLRADRPESVALHGNVTVHGQSFARREVTRNLARDYPAPVEGHVNIGLLHTAATGRDGHANYAPCEVAQLAGHGYRYWALGHIHAREELHRDPWIVFPGNLQGRHINEAGAKGAALVTLAGGGVAQVEHLALDVLRWARLTVDVTGAPDADAARALALEALGRALDAAEGRMLVARVTLAGACPAHGALARDAAATRDQLRAEAAGLGDRLFVEEVRLETRPPLDPAALAARPDAVGRLAQAIAGTPADALAAALAEHATALLAKGSALREALGEDHPAVRLAAGELPEALLARARDLLLAELAEA